MATASALMARVQSELGDPSADSNGGAFTSAVIYGWLDEAQKEWCIRLMPLGGIDSQSVVTDQDSVALPSDCIMLDAISSRRGWLKQVKPVNISEWLNQQTAVRTALATDPELWAEVDNRAYVFPRYSGSSLTSTLNASTSTTATTLTMGSTGNLTSFGRAKISSEIIEYTGKTTTTLTGVRRGVGNTTATSYASGETVTQCDYNAYYRRYPIALASTASPEIRTVYHEKLLLYAKYLGYTREGSSDKAKDMFQLWQTALEGAAFAEGQRNLEPLRITNAL